MIRVSAPHFTAGALLRAGKVSDAAPIIRYMLGWTAEKVCAYAARKGWRAEVTP